ncbi:hypothetical protein BB559_002656 [Furculomyces boomerangus]|uniref:Uncharacterized protein n=1 Tax=Furculomyces boomerangus TaxID=61424 RepID=A0A2T9YTM0_9FUNG|nr:hypothetical protein BB559_004967 [Furculomyces boomerangus]PVU95690.1 hypothetical protein BB559_002656 [Furculomyces boomerangus]
MNWTGGERNRIRPAHIAKNKQKNYFINAKVAHKGVTNKSSILLPSQHNNPNKRSKWINILAQRKFHKSMDLLGITNRDKPENTSLVEIDRVSVLDKFDSASQANATTSFTTVNLLPRNRENYESQNETSSSISIKYPENHSVCTQNILY